MEACSNKEVSQRREAGTHPGGAIHKHEEKVDQSNQQHSLEFFLSQAEDIAPLPSLTAAAAGDNNSDPLVVLRRRDSDPGAYAAVGGNFVRLRPVLPVGLLLVAPPPSTERKQGRQELELPPVDNANSSSNNDNVLLGETTGANDSLIRAESIIDGTESQQHLPTAEPISLLRAKKLWRKKLCWSLTVEALAAIIIVLGITIWVFFGGTDQKHPTHKKTNGGAIQIPATQQGVIITQVPSTATSSPMEEVLANLNLPGYTLEALKDHNNPQYKAYAWLASNNQASLATYPDWRLIQRYALATFYYATTGDHWVKRDGWLDWQTHECNWEQASMGQEDSVLLHCDDTGHVRGLSFYANKLVGTIPPELALLSSSLERLELMKNTELKGTLPTQIGLLSKLSILRLLSTNLSGRLPTELGQLRNLTNVDLGSKQISGTVPSELGLLGNLKELSFTEMGLTGLLPSEFYELQQLEVFALNGCLGVDHGSVLSSLTASHMHHLEVLALTGGDGGGAESKNAIPTTIGRLSNLGSLFLHSWKLQGTLPSEVGILQKLTSLNIAETSLSRSLPSELFSLHDLIYLGLSSNNFTGELSPRLFENLRNLQWLYLNNNQFVGTLAAEIGLVSGLKKLELQHTSLSGPLPSELLLLPNLTGLAVANTSLSGSISDGLCSILHRIEYECHGSDQCYPKKVTTSVCGGTALCGCSCAPC